MFGAAWCLREARRVWCTLTSQLSEVQIGASAVSCVHALSEAVLAPEAVEDDSVDRDDNDFHDDLDDTADQRPVLETADQSVVDVVFEELAALVVLARPAPEVLTFTIILGALKNTGTDDPHDDAEEEPADGEHGVVDSDLFGSAVATTAVSKDDDNSKDERYTGDAEDDDLGPERSVWGPWW